MQFCMATHCLPFGLSPDSYKINFKSSCSSVPQAAIVMFSDRGSSYNPLVFQAVRLLGPPARFEASKLKVEFKGEEKNRYTRIVPRTYTLSHCDFTADLTLTISRLIHLDQLKGWYNKDDVVAQWTEVNGDVCLDVHCYVSGPNPLLVLVAELRYHIFSKELPLNTLIIDESPCPVSPYQCRCFLAGTSPSTEYQSRCRNFTLFILN
ncbi:magnesium dechelatase SGRL, chloroplastic-like isoform X3 [Apium graveolens]|uniref:magnesium dechelatase SGRL, chloroplastic-like isoform X3 n=1 Tax=Apium graveolens TaxID=4045 RepID=UPI003D7B6510